MKRRSRIGLGLILGLTLGLPMGTIYNVIADNPSSENVLPLDQLRTFTSVYARIKSDYVEDVEDAELIENAIRGMLSGLDPHSNYMDVSEFKDLTIGTTGEFGGLGIEVSMENGFVKVVAPIDDTPAYKAGVKAGDLVIRLDDTPVKGLTLNEAVDIMRGKVGTDLLLTIVREGEVKPLKITVTRDIIRVKSVKNRTLEPGYGYLRIASFQSRTTQGVIDAVAELKEQNDGNLKGLVLDLRNNPGGVLNAAVGVSDAFLDDGLIVYTEGRISDSKLRYDASRGDILDGAPLIVLVNGGSASASEIVAGALQDHNRGAVVGTKTFGKGSVQTILPLQKGNALKLTTAKYYTPSGSSIQAQGIEPDIVLTPVTVSTKEHAGISRIKEADLNGHLENGDSDNTDEHKPGGTSKKDAKDEVSLAEQDYALYEALNLLKGMVFLTQK